MERDGEPISDSKPEFDGNLMSIEYARPDLTKSKNPFRIASFFTSVFLASTPALLLTDGLHNTMPFLFPWIVAGIVATILAIGTWHSLWTQSDIRLKRGRSVLVMLACAWLVGGTIIAAWWPGIDPHTLSRRLNGCTNNLQQIGVAMLIYSNSNSRNYPSSIDTLVATGEIAPTQLFCPAALQDAVAEDLSAPTWPSYWYLGKGVTNMCDPSTVLVVELPGHHEDHSITVLHADGFIERLRASEASVMLSDLVSGINPPRSITERQQIGVK